MTLLCMSPATVGDLNCNEELAGNSDQRPGVKREIMTNWGDSEVYQLFLRAGDGGNRCFFVLTKVEVKAEMAYFGRGGGLRSG